MFYENPQLIHEASKKLISSNNCKLRFKIRKWHILYSNNGRKKENIEIKEAIKELEKLNVGEYHDISRDGTGEGWQY